MNNTELKSLICPALLGKRTSNTENEPDFEKRRRSDLESSASD